MFVVAVFLLGLPLCLWLLSFNCNKLMSLSWKQAGITELPNHVSEFVRSVQGAWSVIFIVRHSRLIISTYNIIICYDPNPNSLCERNECPQCVVDICNALNALWTS